MEPRALIPPILAPRAAGVECPRDAAASFWFYFRSVLMLTLPFSAVPAVLRLLNAVIAGIGLRVFTNHRIREYVRKLDALAP